MIRAEVIYNFAMTHSMVFIVGTLWVIGASTLIMEFILYLHDFMHHKYLHYISMTLCIVSIYVMQNKIEKLDNTNREIFVLWTTIFSHRAV